MAREAAVEARFRERIKQEREQRGWSQAALAEKLKRNGLKGFYATTVAKVESGERAVRIDEAAALADLFDVSVDALMGRKPGGQTSELSFQLRTMRDTARQSCQAAFSGSEVIRELLDDLPAEEFEHSALLNSSARKAWERLHDAYGELITLVGVSHELLRRQQGRPEMTDEELLGMGGE